MMGMKTLRLVLSVGSMNELINEHYIQIIIEIDLNAVVLS
tara:strand:+ start:548 stop:667 length:120 start_codon:yes stop_codon:yes gene_type:complete